MGVPNQSRGTRSGSNREELWLFTLTIPSRPNCRLGAEPFWKIGGGKNLEPQAGDRQVRFRDVSESLNFITTFVSEYPSEKVDFWLYQANGGGLGAFDYDLDGDCDLYVVQTGGDPRVSNSSVANQLFRNLDGTSLLDISVASSSEDRVTDRAFVLQTLIRMGGLI